MAMPLLMKGLMLVMRSVIEIPPLLLSSFYRFHLKSSDEMFPFMSSMDEDSPKSDPIGKLDVRGLLHLQVGVL